MVNKREVLRKPVEVHFHQHVNQHVNVKGTAPPPYVTSFAKRAGSSSPTRGQVKRSRLSLSPGECAYDGERSASPSPGPPATNPPPGHGSTIREQLHKLLANEAPESNQPLRQRLLHVEKTLKEAFNDITSLNKELALFRKERWEMVARHHKDLQEIDAQIASIEEMKLRVLDTGRPAVDELKALCQDSLLTQDDHEMTEKDSDGDGHGSEAETVI